MSVLDECSGSCGLEGMCGVAVHLDTLSPLVQIRQRVTLPQTPFCSVFLVPVVEMFPWFCCVYVFSIVLVCVYSRMVV